MTKPHTQPEPSDGMASILKVAAKMDQELSELPMPSHAAIVNILSQLCEHRLAMVHREEQKKAEQAKREAQFSPHAQQQKM